MLVKVKRATLRGFTVKITDTTLVEIEVDSRESLAKIRDTYLRGSGMMVLADIIHEIRRRVSRIPEEQWPATMEFAIITKKDAKMVRLTAKALAEIKPY